MYDNGKVVVSFFIVYVYRNGNAPNPDKVETLAIVRKANEHRLRQRMLELLSIPD